MAPPRPVDRATSFVAMLWVYTLALAALTWVAVDLSDWHPLGQMLVADLAAVGVVFLASLGLNNSSVVDPYWALAPFPIACWWFAGEGGLPAREALVAGLLLLWGARLAGRLWRRWPGLHHEDWRHARHRALGPWLYWPLSLGVLHLLPAVVGFAGLLPVWALSEAADPLGPLTWIGAATCLAGIALSAAADRQLHTFRAAHPAPDALLQTGPWAWVRHPNYLGEVVFWWGLWGIALGAGWRTVWTAVGPMWVTALFLFVSIPLLEVRMAATRGEAWRAYAARTPALFPVFRR